MEDMLKQLAQRLPTPVSAGGAAGNATGQNNEEEERYQKSLAALSRKSGQVTTEPADGTPQAASLSALKEPDPDTPAAATDNASPVTGVADLPAAPAPVQMAEDSSFQTFLRGHGWHPQGEHKRNIARVATCDCCLITCCILSCNCCCGRYGSFACTYCGGACNCDSGD